MADEKQRQKRLADKRKRREKRKQQKGGAGEASQVVAQIAAHLPKLSTALSAFADPLLDLLPDGADAEDCRAALQVAMIVWNGSLARERGVEDSFSELLPEACIRLAERTGRPLAEVEAVVASLPARKAGLFKHDHRLLAAVDVVDLGDGFHITALGIDQDALDAAGERQETGGDGLLRRLLNRLLP